MVAISIGVPIHNVDSHLRRCLNSIIQQSFQDFEVIMVDDGSTDNSFEICQEYAFKDKRFKLYHQENKGLADARNICLKHMQGEYVVWVEATDSIEVNYLEHLINIQKQSQAEIIISGSKEYQNQKFTQEVSLQPYFSELKDKSYVNTYRYQNLISLLSQWSSFYYNWSKLIKKDLYRGIRYENISSDISTFGKIYLRSASTVVTSETLYNHENMMVPKKNDAELLKIYRDRKQALEELVLFSELMNYGPFEIKNISIQHLNIVYKSILSGLTESGKQKLEDLMTPSHKIRVLEIGETLDYILKNQSSVVRFGDGELFLISGQGIVYQDYHKDLAKRLKEILFIQSSPNLVVCMTDVFMNPDNYNQISQGFWKQLIFWNKNLLNDLGEKTQWFGNSFISRPYMDIVDKTQSQSYFEKLKRIWKNKDVLIVEGKLTRSGIGNDLFEGVKSLKRIIAPSKNAFDKYSELLSLSQKYGKGKLILLMLGPTAKVLAYDLSQLGYQAIDIGHIDSEYEWFKMGATEKVALKNKHTAENNLDTGVVLEDNDVFNKQVIIDISGAD
ncbi:SP_1767 family glycosyltransferase [Ligilactobacillus salivarius]|uniref:SP_1767 family glycosyltransferase n=1 Tax=Ligilactobacillus salivarius TaxID=1624 RepID=UPI00195E7AEA|nr:SP_1767 family glycosyltransferase [Ligilactobacillus salivarius]MBM6956534.1 SP_1767 family glycosyltransferase [Ligilactobacillus salivarius]